MQLLLIGMQRDHSNAMQMVNGEDSTSLLECILSMHWDLPHALECIIITKMHGDHSNSMQMVRIQLHYWNVESSP